MISLAGIAASQIGAAFKCGSPDQASLRLGFASNRVLFNGNAMEAALYFYGVTATHSDSAIRFVRKLLQEELTAPNSSSFHVWAVRVSPGEKR
jgi:hypothetical protein